MNKEEIMKRIPHRSSMLIVDQITAMDKGHIEGTYFVRGDEFFLDGHYPDYPIVPGVILCEMMAQVMAVYCSDKKVTGVPLLAKLNNVLFKNIVKPGDNVTINLDIDKDTSRLVSGLGKILVEKKVCSEANLTVVIC